MMTILLILLGVLTRVVPHLSQFTAVLAVGMLAGVYLNARRALLLSMVVMIASDLVLGFHDTMLYTYGSMVLITLLGVWLKTRKSPMAILGGSLASALIFFVVTNFGAFLSLYPRTWQGLAECYTMALPFFRTTVASTVAYSLVIYFAFELILKRVKSVNSARLL